MLDIFGKAAVVLMHDLGEFGPGVLVRGIRRTRHQNTEKSGGKTRKTVIHF